MSLVVLAIAAAHAIPPIIGAVAKKSRGGVVAGIAVGAIAAVALGGAVFVVPDLLGVALGAWIGFSMIGKTDAHPTGQD